MPAHVAGIHVFLRFCTASKTWMAGTSPAMTMRRVSIPNLGKKHVRFAWWQAVQ